MANRRIAMLIMIGALGVGPAGFAAAQPVQVTGAEMEGWFASDEMAVAGISLNNGCHWITKGPLQARSQTVYCPNRTTFTITGTAQIQGNLLCSKFTYPDGGRFEACQELYKIGDNKYEARVDGVPRNTMYRLIR